MGMQYTLREKIFANPNTRLLDSPQVSITRFEQAFKVNIYSLITPSAISKKKRSQYWRRKHLNNWLDKFALLTKLSMDYRSYRRKYNNFNSYLFPGTSYLVFPQPHATIYRPDFYSLFRQYRLLPRTALLNPKAKKTNQPNPALLYGLQVHTLKSNNSGSQEVTPPQPYFLTQSRQALY